MRHRFLSALLEQWDAGRTSHLLDAEAEVEQAVRGIGLPVWPLDLIDEAAESVAQLSRGALEDVLIQHHRTGWKQQESGTEWESRHQHLVHLVAVTFAGWFTLKACVCFSSRFKWKSALLLLLTPVKPNIQHIVFSVEKQSDLIYPFTITEFLPELFSLQKLTWWRLMETNMHF